MGESAQFFGNRGDNFLQSLKMKVERFLYCSLFFCDLNGNILGNLDKSIFLLFEL